MKSITPEQFIDVNKMRTFLELAVEQYQKAPGWFVEWLDEMYIRLSEEGWKTITLDELMTIDKLYKDGQWQYESYAVNSVYRLFDRMGRSTVGIAGY